jgi:superfamily II DNA or RNA helicase
MGLVEGIEHGYLVPVRGREIEVKEIDLRKVDASGNDLNQGQLDEMMVEANEGVVQGMLHHSGDRQGIVFFPGVASAELAAARLNAIKDGCAMSVSGETPKEERAAIMDAFRKGEFQFLTNCMVATEGFDAPSASVVGIARATKSRSLYAQMTGRGTRVLPGVVDAIEGQENAAARRNAIAASAKPSCLLIDFVGNSGRHILVNPMDLLGGNYDEPTRKRAKEIAAESDGEVDIQAALEQAKEDLVRRDLERKALAAAAKTIEARVTATSRSFDPFKHLGVDLAREDKFNIEFGFTPMSENQRAFLVQRGFSGEELKGVSKRAATKLISATVERSKKGLASKPQADTLARNGIVDKNITAQAANQVVSYIRQQRRAGLPADQAIINLLTSNEEF